jgi:hypothetical protein
LLKRESLIAKFYMRNYFIYAGVFPHDLRDTGSRFGFHKPAQGW